MAMERVERKLLTILAADVVRYSRHMGNVARVRIGGRVLRENSWARKPEPLMVTGA
jgi:hypothetical protein